MSRTFHHGERRILVRGVRKEQPDLRRLARALIELAQAEAERDAETEHRRSEGPGTKQDQKNTRPGGKPSPTTGDTA